MFGERPRGRFFPIACISVLFRRVLERSWKAHGDTVWPEGFDPEAAGVIFE